MAIPRDEKREKIEDKKFSAAGLKKKLFGMSIVFKANFRIRRYSLFW